ncbi:hypothetical protein [Roseisolibacter sp. H3M3-2]|uniref:hypothetical protein n=1 Tax=Roseisolibacter sp. H3M3-2 TaxID=3031323 RepID=UPI0023DBC407|nr:hypothetical protein [Roseisolibacter sp. H3M3-2]MDF1502603.1 hypothetical protein [Roseisolibacter sp. H3M3-2]
MSERRPTPPDPTRDRPAPAPAGGDDVHPADPAHDLSDSPAHAQPPDAYTEPPGSHRRGPDGPALDVGG